VVGQHDLGADHIRGVGVVRVVGVALLGPVTPLLELGGGVFVGVDRHRTVGGPERDVAERVVEVPMGVDDVNDVTGPEPSYVVDDLPRGRRGAVGVDHE
jgi:hypothetical protein